MTSIIMLTGSELRHQFLRKYVALSDGITVINTYCEGQEKNLQSLVRKQSNATDKRLQHLEAREQAEDDFFRPFLETVSDQSAPMHLPQGDINLPAYTQAIIDSNPDLLVAYGCSIIREPLLSAFQGRFLNVHLGLSPYYRGGATNYWPLVNGEPEYVGATFMHIDAGIDTGEIIHQIRAKFAWGDTPSQIGNRLIAKVARVYRDLIVHFDQLAKLPQLPVPPTAKVYRNKDYTEESVEILYKNFRDGLIEKYLSETDERCANAPILTNPAVARPL